MLRDTPDFFFKFHLYSKMLIEHLIQLYFHNTAVIWMKVCLYRVKPYTINQSINQNIRTKYLMKHWEDSIHAPIASSSVLCKVQSSQEHSFSYLDSLFTFVFVSHRACLPCLPPFPTSLLSGINMICFH